jgi:hypothetical protein
LICLDFARVPLSLSPVEGPPPSGPQESRGIDDATILTERVDVEMRRVELATG